MSPTNFHTPSAEPVAGVDFYADGETPAGKKPRATLEWNLQQACYVWARRNITEPFLWLSMDRGAGSKMQRIREAQRGFQPGTPDAVVLAVAKTAFFEFKAPKGVVSPAQTAMGDQLGTLLHDWFLVRSVAGFCGALQTARISVHPLGVEHALAADRALAARIAAPPKSARATKAAPRFTMGKRAVGRARKAGVFI